MHAIGIAICWDLIEGHLTCAVFDRTDSAAMAPPGRNSYEPLLPGRPLRLSTPEALPPLPRLAGQVTIVGAHLLADFVDRPTGERGQGHQLVDRRNPQEDARRLW